MVILLAEVKTAQKGETICGTPLSVFPNPRVLTP